MTNDRAVTEDRTTSDELIAIDGSRGEGGGQVLRTCLTLALVTGRGFRIDGIRAGRARPGLLRQHLACVRCATEVGDAEVSGDQLGATSLTFRPRALRAGSYRASVGSAGSATLVLQTVLPALMHAEGPSDVVVEGGTHNDAAPPWDFLAQAWMPTVRAMGVTIDGTLERHGFYPAGGGRVAVSLTPSASRDLTPLTLETRGALRRIGVVALVAGVAARVAHQEAHLIAEALGAAQSDVRIAQSDVRIAQSDVQIHELPAAHGPGNIAYCVIESEHATELVTAFGARGLRAEVVAERVVTAARAYLASDAPVGVHLADQLVLLQALAVHARGGSAAFRTLPLDAHTTTQLALIPRFLDVSCSVVAEPSGAVRVVLQRA